MYLLANLVPGVHTFGTAACLLVRLRPWVLAVHVSTSEHTFALCHFPQQEQPCENHSFQDELDLANHLPSWSALMYSGIGWHKAR